MWCESILGNARDRSEASGQKVIDYLDLQWSECRNVIRKQTTGGEPIRVLLPAGEQLRDGDVIFEDASRIVIVRVLPCDVTVADVPDAHQLAVLAMELGNLHLPAQVDDASISFVEDEAAMRVLEQMSIPWRRERRRFEPTKIISMPGVGRSEIQLIRSGG